VIGYAPRKHFIEGIIMGKGDRKTAKGKRNISSYGNARATTVKKPVTKVAVAAKPKAPVVAKKAPARKAAAK
jgi:30S ribosomal protein S31